LGILKDFERVLDEMDIYVYDNWLDGEIAYGPKIDKHWITVGLMWNRDNMPEPEGGQRLYDIGCKVKYQKSHLIEPRKIRSPKDIRPGTKKGKLDRNPIWIVEIRMPTTLAFDVYKGYMSKMKSKSTTKGTPQNTTPVPETLPIGMNMNTNMQPPMGSMGQGGQGI